MADLINIARPYALAAFECAKESKQILVWENFLKAAATTAEDAKVSALLANPEIFSSKLFELFSGVLDSLLDTQRKNFLHLLAQNKRLMVLPEIFHAFKAYVAALEKMSNVRLVTAIEMNEEMRDKFKTALAKRIQRDVSLECEVDANIIAGAIIHIGDCVIDGSIRGQLSRLQQNLTG